MKKYGVISSTLLGCMLAACANGQSSGEKTEPGRTNARGGLTAESIGTPAGDVDAVSKGSGKISLGPGILRLVDLAKRDLAIRVGIEEDAIGILQAEFVTWPDSSIGCPQSGYQYLQVLMNGSLIRLSANKTVYQYHSGGQRPPFHCKKPSPDKPPAYADGEA